MISFSPKHHRLTAVVVREYNYDANKDKTVQKLDV